MPEGLVSVAEAAEQYGVHPATIRRWIDRGLVPAYRVGERRIGIKASDLATVVKPRPAGERRGSAGAQAPIPGYLTLQQIAIPQRMTEEEQERVRRLLERIDRRREELARKYGKMTPPSWVLINEARDVRSRQLMGEDVEE